MYLLYFSGVYCVFSFLSSGSCVLSLYLQRILSVSFISPMYPVCIVHFSCAFSLSPVWSVYLSGVSCVLSLFLRFILCMCLVYLSGVSCVFSHIYLVYPVCLVCFSGVSCAFCLFLHCTLCLFSLISPLYPVCFVYIFGKSFVSGLS